jgi:colanic acid biosynthesis glycosyl transferase WcaI
VNVLLVTAYYPPEVGSASDLYHDLASELHRQGDAVTVLTTHPRGYSLPENSSIKPSQSPVSVRQEDSVRVIRVWTYLAPRDAPTLRGLEHILMPFFMSLALPYLRNMDVVMVYSPPLPLGLVGMLCSFLYRSNLVMNVQDIHPRALIDLKILTNLYAIRFFYWMEKTLYRYSSRIVVHSQGNQRFLAAQGAAPDKVSTVYNWTRTAANPSDEEVNRIRAKLCFDARVNVCYAGLLSYSQDLDTVVECAKSMLSDAEVGFVIVGDGPKRRSLQGKARRYGLNNARFHPYLPVDEYRAFLRAADVCLVPLSSGTVNTPVVPKKLQDIMASGKALIALVPLDNDVKNIVDEAGSGVVVESGRADLLKEAIIRLKEGETRSRLGENGKLYAGEHFSLEKNVHRIREILASATGE